MPLPAMAPRIIMAMRILVIITGMITIMTIERLAGGDHLILHSWFSPAFPIGAFSFSHGLEWAVEAGDITDRQSAVAWIGDLLRHGSAMNDAIVLAEAYRAETQNDGRRLHEIAELAAAFQPGRERALESQVQGQAFHDAIMAAWPPPRPLLVRQIWHGPLAYAVAVGTIAAAHGLSLRSTVEAYLAAFVANLVSATIRLSALGQSDGQRIIAALLPDVQETAARAMSAQLEDLGGSCLRADLASLRHETQYTRLFRS